MIENESFLADLLPPSAQRKPIADYFLRTYRFAHDLVVDQTAIFRAGSELILRVRFSEVIRLDTRRMKLLSHSERAGRRLKGVVICKPTPKKMYQFGALKESQGCYSCSFAISHAVAVLPQLMHSNYLWIKEVSQGKIEQPLKRGQHDEKLVHLLEALLEPVQEPTLAPAQASTGSGSGKGSLPGKGNSHADICAAMEARGPYLTDPVGKCLRHFRTVNELPRADINLCLGDSATYAASLAGRDLAAEFDPVRSESCFLRWFAELRHQVWSPAYPVLVDWAAGVLRTPEHRFALLTDVESCLYRKDDSGRFEGAKPSASPETTGPYEDIQEAALRDIPETERRTLIDARLGQGKFRQELWKDLWGRCAVTGCKNERLLRASHIKPWRLCDNRERLDKYNGLLLTPALDLLFDTGLISFDDTGSIMFSPALSVNDAEKLGVQKEMRLCNVYPGNRPYLAVHRKLHGYLQKS